MHSVTTLPAMTALTNVVECCTLFSIAAVKAEELEIRLFLNTKAGLEDQWRRMLLQDHYQSQWVQF